MIYAGLYEEWKPDRRGYLQEMRASNEMKRARTVSVSEKETAKRGHPREYCAFNENTLPRR